MSGGRASDRSVFRRSLVDQAARLVVLGVLVAVIALAAVGAPRLTERLIDGNLRHTVSSASAPSRDLISEIDAQHRLPSKPGTSEYTIAPTWNAMPATLRHATSSMPSELRDVVGSGRFTGIASPVQGGGLDPGFNSSKTPDAPSGGQILSVEAYPGLKADASLVSGRWPRESASATGPVEVVMTADAASALRWHLGETQHIFHSPFDRVVKLVGTIRPRQTESDYWALDTTRARIVVQTNSDGQQYRRAVIWVNADSWDEIGGRFPGNSIESWFPVDGDAVALSTLPDLQNGLDLFLTNPEPIHDGTQDGHVLRLSSSLPGILSAFSVTALASSSIVALTMAAAAGVALLTLLLTVRLLVASRASVRSLMRTRGASLATLGLRTAAELAVAAVPAALVGGVVGIALVAVPVGVDPSVPFAFGTREVLTVVVCALIAPAAAACFVLAGDGLPAAAKSAAQRLSWIGQAALVVLAAAALVVVVEGGVAGGESSVDPLVVLTPLLLALAGAAVVLRLFPLLVRMLRGGLPSRGRAASFVGLTEARATTGVAWMVTAAVVATSMGVLSVVLVTSALGVTVTTGGTNASGPSSVAPVIVPGLLGITIAGIVLSVACAAAAFAASSVADARARRLRTVTLRTLGFERSAPGIVAAWITVPVAIVSVVVGCALGVLIAIPTLPAIVSTGSGSAATVVIGWVPILAAAGSILVLAVVAGVVPALVDRRATLDDGDGTGTRRGKASARSSRPAGSRPAGSTSPGSTPASSTPASSTPASSTPASSTPAGSKAAPRRQA
ncbi:FtsX-like permease family protein [Rathayibacter sp. CAU 1779]